MVWRWKGDSIWLSFALCSDSVPPTICLHQAPSSQRRKSEMHSRCAWVICILIIFPVVVLVPEWQSFLLASFLHAFWSCLVWYTWESVQMSLLLFFVGWPWAYVSMSNGCMTYKWVEATTIEFFSTWVLWVPNNLLTCNSMWGERFDCEAVIHFVGIGPVPWHRIFGWFLSWCPTSCTLSLTKPV